MLIYIYIYIARMMVVKVQDGGVCREYVVVGVDRGRFASALVGSLQASAWSLLLNALPTMLQAAVGMVLVIVVAGSGANGRKHL